MMAEMSATEFMEWHEVMKLDPFGGIRSDIQAAIIASTVANMSGKTVKKDVKPADFLPEFMPRESESRRHRQSPEEMMAAFLSIAKTNATKKEKPN